MVEASPSVFSSPPRPPPRRHRSVRRWTLPSDWDWNGYSDVGGSDRKICLISSSNHDPASLVKNVIHKRVLHISSCYDCCSPTNQFAEVTVQDEI
jgi:hypothetical protein